jgi:kynurenine/2-aminoadipate aminotransferase
LIQVIVHCLLAQWGLDGLEAHFKSVQALYKSKRDCMLAAAQRHLTGLAEWNEPHAGMFLWIMVHGIKDTHQFIMDGGKKYGVFLMPGKHFLTNTNESSPYIRASYSLATPEEINMVSFFANLNQWYYGLHSYYNRVNNFLFFPGLREAC